MVMCDLTLVELGRLANDCWKSVASAEVYRCWIIPLDGSRTPLFQRSQLALKFVLPVLVGLRVQIQMLAPGFVSSIVCFRPEKQVSICLLCWRMRLV